MLEKSLRENFVPWGWELDFQRRSHVGEARGSPTLPEIMFRVSKKQGHKTIRFKKQETKTYNFFSPPWEAFGHDSGEKINKSQQYKGVEEGSHTHGSTIKRRNIRETGKQTLSSPLQSQASMCFNFLLHIPIWKKCF